LSNVGFTMLIYVYYNARSTKQKLKWSLIYSLLYEENTNNNYISDTFFALFKIAVKI
jgi:hypothetical protein